MTIVAFSVPAELLIAFSHGAHKEGAHHTTTHIQHLNRGVSLFGQAEADEGHGIERIRVISIHGKYQRSIDTTDTTTGYVQGHRNDTRVSTAIVGNDHPGIIGVGAQAG